VGLDGVVTSLVEQVASSSWAEKETVQSAILEYCAQSFKSVEEIAEALHRSPATIQQNYVRGMVSDGLLLPRYPEKPNHPRQAYKSSPG
jgi:hypothetical protein